MKKKKNQKQERKKRKKPIMGPSVMMDDLVLQFLDDTTRILQTMDASQFCRPDGSTHDRTLAECRQYVLDVQKSNLCRVVYHYNEQQNTGFTVEQIQERLAHLKQDPSLDHRLEQSTKNLEEAARGTLVAFVLYGQYQQQHQQQQHHHQPHSLSHPSMTNHLLQTTGILDRTKLLEFIGLCQACVKLPIVQQHLIDGTPLFPSMMSNHGSSQDTTASTTTTTATTIPTAHQFPQYRLEQLQRLLAQAVGIHPDWMTHELQRIFTTSDDHEYKDDTELLQLLERLIVQMNHAITTASLAQSQQTLSDIDEGGVTRVVAVHHSELFMDDPTIISSVSPTDDDMESHQHRQQHHQHRQHHLPPIQQSMDIAHHPIHPDEQKEQLRLASQAAVLQQELLAELFQMSDRDRSWMLEQAEQAHQEFVDRASNIPPGPERVQFITSIDPSTSRLLAMHKIWTQLLADHGGKPPTIYNQSSHRDGL